MTGGAWVDVRHRCLRPSARDAEAAGVGPGSVWACYECAARHRVVNLDVEFTGGSFEPVVTWEVVR